MTVPSIPEYTIRALIGEGSTGQVFAADYSGQSLMALKAFAPGMVNRQLVSDALVKLYNRDEHPGIVTVHDFDLASEQAFVATSLHGEPYQDKNGQEALRPRTIQGLMGHLIAEDAWGYLQQISDALAFLHRRRVIHCNLEPNNVLLDSSTPPQVKLTDFSQGLVGSVPNLVPGDSVFYAAPEQIRQPEHYFGGRAERWDVYAFGVLAYQLLTGNLPRLASAHAEIKQREAANGRFSYDYGILADMIGDQAAYEWPSPAENDDESTRRAIIDRCLEVDPEDRFPDMREVALAFQAIEEENERREEHRKIASEQLRRDKESSGLKKICAVLGLLALGGLGGAAYFSQKSGGDGTLTKYIEPEDVDTSSSSSSSGVSQAELDEMKALVETSTENLGESQSALDELFALVISRDHEGNPNYDLPEESRGLLLNYYEEFATRHQANPDLALEVAKANSNAGEIHLTMGDANSALTHIQKASEKINTLRGQSPDNVRLTIAAARIIHNLSETQKLAGHYKAAAASAVTENEIWANLHQANPTSAQATRALGESLLFLGERMLDINRPADTGLNIQRAKTLFQGLEAEGKMALEDVVALSRCDHLLGLSERANGNTNDAIKLQVEAVDRLLNVKISSPETPRDQLYLLATYYGELADELAETGDREGSHIANKEATALLLDLVASSGSSPGYHYELSRRFNTQAAILRDAGKGKDARVAAQKGISILRDILKVYPKRNDFSLELALQLGDMMDLYADVSMVQEVLDTGAESIRITDNLLNNDLDPENANAKRDLYRDHFGHLQLRYAQHLDRYSSKDARLKGLALKRYEKGVKQLESLVASGITSDELTKEIDSAKARIKALGGSAG